MTTTAELRAAAKFASAVYRERASWAYHGYVRRDPLAQLRTRSGRADPYRVYERIRAEGPLSKTRLGNWASPSHAMCNRVLRDRHFGVRPADVPSPGDEFDLSFLELNPPEHTRLRRLVAPAFSPKQMTGYRERIEKTVHQLLDDIDARGDAFDLVTEFAAPLPIAVITDLLGVPGNRAEEFARYGATIGSALDGIRSVSHARDLMAANAALEALFGDLFALRRREPSGDIVSAIVAAEGDQVRTAEMLSLCVLLLIAGFETTVNLISNGVLALLDHPEQWALLRADPELSAAAVEEALRYDPPVQRTSRVALQDLELDGRPVHKDQWVVTLIGAANRDPEVFADPSRFDLTRSRSVEHLSFSSGIHYCLGQPLARLEATIAFGALAQRKPRLRREGRVVRRNATTIRGPLHLPVNA